MESATTLNHGITLNLYERENSLYVKALAKHATYEVELPLNSIINTKEIQTNAKSGTFTVISESNHQLKLKIADTELKLLSEEKAITNEFQQTITTLTNNFQTQLERNVRLQDETKKLRIDLDELSKKFFEMALQFKDLSKTVSENQNLKIQLQEVKEELTQLKKQQAEALLHTSKPEIETAKTKHDIESLESIESQKSISVEKPDLKQNSISEEKPVTEEKSISQVNPRGESEEQDTLNMIMSFFSKKIETNEDSTPVQEKRADIHPELALAYQILMKIPRVHWSYFNHSKVLDRIVDQTTIQGFFSQEVTSMNLLFRASENYFSARLFHQKCNNTPNTLVFARTEYNKIIGGFTPLLWESPFGETVKNKKDLKGDSFIFSLTDKEKFVLKNKENAIVNKSSWGPVFGCDLVINDKAHEKANCYSKIGTSYESKNGDKNGHQRIGGGETSHFKIKEWEVWQVEFKKQEIQDEKTLALEQLIKVLKRGQLEKRQENGKLI